MELCSMLCGSLHKRGVWGRMDTCIHRWTFLVAQTVKTTCNAGDPGLIPGPGRSLGEGNGYQLHYSCLENPMDKGAWQATVHGVARSQHNWVLTFPCLCMVESLHCSPETTMTLLISCIPVKNKKLKKENQTIMGFSSSFLGSWCEYKRP